MKKNLLLAVLICIITVSLSGQSWAFGSRHGGGSNGHSSNGSNSSGDNSFTGNNSGTTNNGSGNTQNPDIGNNSNPAPQGQSNFPVAPVPEPLSLSLLGTGLAGLILRRKKNQP